jgi:transglutaminase-like putative cysteine protease
MTYQIIHNTTYNYSQPVELNPHLLRLRSRSDCNQNLTSFRLDINPAPAGQSDLVDLGGNSVTKIWFTEKISSLSITATSTVETYCTNPFNYLLEPWATQLPIIDYPASLLDHLQPYMASHLDPVATQLAQDIWQQTQGQIVPFLSALNNQIYQNCQYTMREIGEPYPPSYTWHQKIGSCRDTAVLFIAACRSMGIAARFVSGYREGELPNEPRHLHAWAEVYLPGAGWKGYDQTEGLAVSDNHIVLATSVHPRHASPITGSIRGVAETQMNYSLSIEKL